jgi:hypothetical protein
MTERLRLSPQRTTTSQKLKQFFKRRDSTDELAAAVAAVSTSATNSPTSGNYSAPATLATRHASSPSALDASVTMAVASPSLSSLSSQPMSPASVQPLSSSPAPAALTPSTSSPRATSSRNRSVKESKEISKLVDAARFKHAGAPVAPEFDALRLEDIALPTASELASLQRPLFSKFVVINRAVAEWRVLLERIEPTLAQFVDRERLLHEARDAFSNLLLRFGRPDARQGAAEVVTNKHRNTASPDDNDGDPDDNTAAAAASPAPAVAAAADRPHKKISTAVNNTSTASIRRTPSQTMDAASRCTLDMSPFMHELGFLLKEVDDQHRTNSERLPELILRPVHRALELIHEFDALLAVANKQEASYIDAFAALMHVKPHDASKSGAHHTIKYEKLLRESATAAEDLSWSLFECVVKFEELLHGGLLGLIPLIIEFVNSQILSLAGQRETFDAALDLLRAEFIAALRLHAGARRNVVDLKRSVLGALERINNVGGSRVLNRIDAVSQQGYCFVRRKVTRGFGGNASAVSSLSPGDGAAASSGGIGALASSVANSMAQQSEPWRRYWLTLNQRDGTLLFERAFVSSSTDADDTMTINLLLASVRPDSPQSGRRNVFELIDAITQVTHQIQAPDIAELRLWIKSIQRSVELCMSRQRPRSMSIDDFDGRELARAINTGGSSPFGSRMQTQQYDALALLRRLADTRGAEVCAECGASSPDWCTINIGQLVCIECSGAHRKLGVKVSVVRSLTLDQLDEATVQFLLNASNARINEYYEAKLGDAPRDTDVAWSGTKRLATRAQQNDRFAFVTAKYVELRWADGAPPPVFARYASLSDQTSPSATLARLSSDDNNNANDDNESPDSDATPPTSPHSKGTSPRRKSRRRHHHRKGHSERTSLDRKERSPRQ